MLSAAWTQIQGLGSGYLTIKGLGFCNSQRYMHSYIPKSRVVAFKKIFNHFPFYFNFEPRPIFCPIFKILKLNYLYKLSGNVGNSSAVVFGIKFKKKNTLYTNLNQSGI